MHAITINKNIDYSVPIIFKPYVAPPVVAAKIVSTPVAPIKPHTPAVQKTVVTKPPASKPTTQIKNEEKKLVATTKTETVCAKKTEDKPKVEEKAIISSSEVTKPAITKEKIESPKPIAASNTPKTTEDKTSKATAAEHKAVPENAQISHDFREVEALRRGAQLQKELVQKWQPPIGVSPDCSCEISFFVDKKGAIHQLKMVKSSGVVMFDISARQALFAMKLPQWTYGKPLTISFKQ